MAVIIWLLIANPMSRNSAFHKLGKAPGVLNYNFSLLDFPNVAEGVEIVPHGTTRSWFDGMVVKHCEVAQAHDIDLLTFEVPWEVSAEVRDGEWMTYPAGTIFIPNAEFQFRVLGVAPATNAGDALISVARYEAAVSRPVPEVRDMRVAQIGVDCARFGTDAGNVWLNQGLVLTREAELRQVDDFYYADAMKAAALKALAAGATSISFRVDGTGGYGGGKIDIAKADAELFEAARTAGCTLVFHEVHFNAVPLDGEKYYDKATEMYGETAEALKILSVPNPPEHLQADWTERRVRFVARTDNRMRRIVRKLESKDEFKARIKPSRSPDDGDGAALAAAPEHIFTSTGLETAIHALDDYAPIGLD